VAPALSDKIASCHANIYEAVSPARELNDMNALACLALGAIHRGWARSAPGDTAVDEDPPWTR
jgi:hypothetical protein